MHVAAFRPSSRVISVVRDRTQGHTLGGDQSDRLFAWGLVACALIAAWVGTYVAGGSQTAAPHAFYIPLLLASIRFGRRQSFVVAVIAGLAAGPLMPLSTETGTAQGFTNWITRLVIFVLIGQMTAYLARYSLPSLHAEMDRRHLRHEVHAALDHQQFRVVYQPVVRLGTGEIVGVEALIRWEHPEKGNIPPDQFIPAAEQAGCIGPITRFVLHETLQQVAEWRANELTDTDMFKVAVNLSAEELGDPDLAVDVGKAVARSGVPAHWLHLEVTETALTADVDHAVDGLMELRMLGVRLGLDDFGTGQSSLAQLHRFPIDVLKIDRFFLEPLERHERGIALAGGVVALARALGLVTVVEGVETAEQASVLHALGCDLAQGYLFSPPVEAAEMSQLLAAHRPLHAGSASSAPAPAARTR